MDTSEYIKRYLFYLSTESKYIHINTPKTFQAWKENHIEINKHFSNPAS